MVDGAGGHRSTRHVPNHVSSNTWPAKSTTAKPTDQPWESQNEKNYSVRYNTIHMFNSTSCQGPIAKRWHEPSDIPAEMHLKNKGTTHNMNCLTTQPIYIRDHKNTNEHILVCMQGAAGIKHCLIYNVFVSVIGIPFSSTVSTSNLLLMSILR
jgi:hypothetical protein